MVNWLGRRIRPMSQPATCELERTSLLRVGLVGCGYEGACLAAAFANPTVVRPRTEGDHIDMMLVPELEEFARAITEKRPPSITAADGRRVLQVLDAVVAADSDGGPIIIPREWS